MIGAPIMLV